MLAQLILAFVAAAVGAIVRHSFITPLAPHEQTVVDTVRAAVADHAIGLTASALAARQPVSSGGAGANPTPPASPNPSASPARP